MDLGHGLLHGATDREIGRARVVGVDPALQADLGGASAPRLLGAPRNLGKIEVVGFAAEGRAPPPLREGAEAALEGGRRVAM